MPQLHQSVARFSSKNLVNIFSCRKHSLYLIRFYQLLCLFLLLSFQNINSQHFQIEQTEVFVNESWSSTPFESF